MGESLHDFTKGGMDTARVRGDEADIKRRQENARQARGNLAAMVVDAHGGVQAVKRSKKKRIEAADEFAGLLEMLGLNVLPERKPGGCRNPECQAELPMSAASSSGRSSSHTYYKAGYCSPKCWAEVGDG